MRCLSLLILLFAFVNSVFAQSVSDIVMGQRNIGGESFREFQWLLSNSVMLCKQPCAVTDSQAAHFLVGFEHAKQDLVQFFGYDVRPEYDEVEIHINESLTCPAISTASGYATPEYYFSQGQVQKLNIKLCLFEVERDVYNRQNGFNARFHNSVQDNDHYILALHEYAHGIMFGRFQYSMEWIAFWSSWAVGDPRSFKANLCDSGWDWSMTKLGYELCQQFGLQPWQFREVARRLEDLVNTDTGFLWNQRLTGVATTSLADMRRLFSDVLGEDTSKVFYEHFIDDEFVVGTEFELGGAHRHENFNQAIRLSGLDTVAASNQKTKFKIDHQQGGYGLPIPLHSKNSFYLRALDENSHRFTPNTDFSNRLDLDIRIPGAQRNNVTTNDWTISLQMNDGNDFYWRYLPSTYNAATETLSAQINRTGKYAIGPRFRVPRGFWFDPNHPSLVFYFDAQGDYVETSIFTIQSGQILLETNGSATLGNAPKRSSHVFRTPLVETTKKRRIGLFKPSLTTSFWWKSRHNSYVQDLIATAELRNSQLTAREPLDLELQPWLFKKHLAEPAYTGRYHALKSANNVFLQATESTTLLLLNDTNQKELNGYLFALIEKESPYAKVFRISPDCAIECIEELNESGEMIGVIEAEWLDETRLRLSGEIETEHGVLRLDDEFEKVLPEQPSEDSDNTWDEQ